MSLLRTTLVRLGGSAAAETLVTRSPLRALARRFVAGEGVDDAIRAATAAQRRGLRTTVNYLGEAVASWEGARKASERYGELLRRLRQAGCEGNVSLKLSQLGHALDRTCLEANLGPILECAKGDDFVRFDMESSDDTQSTLDVLETLWMQGSPNIGVVLQACLHRTPGDVARMNELGIRVRLCKGAYAEPPSVALQRRDEVAAGFTNCMRLLLRDGRYAAIATHDEDMIEATLAHVQQAGIGPDRFEFQMLFGVRRDLQRRLVDQGWTVRVYIPFGEAWYPYLMRRLAERPANVAFLVGSLAREAIRKPYGIGADAS